jgi:hypothetical protein
VTTRKGPTPALMAIVIGLCVGGMNPSPRLAKWVSLSGVAWAQSCPIEVQAIEDAKPNKLYLYFPTADDSTWPPTTCTIGTPNCFEGSAPVKPLRAFDIANLSDYTGTVGDLEDQIHSVVIDDYCEFNVKVIATTTVPPTTFPRRSTVGIGTDSVGSVSTGVLFGQAQEVDTGDQTLVDFARVWAGGYQTEAGSGGSGVLSGANSTLQRWGFSIGGTAAHEAGHTYGLAHNDDFFQNFPSSGCNDGTDQTKPGEDALTRHLMAQGCHFTDEQRAGFRRHFSDATFGILAANVGLSVETVHNWDFTNPNSSAASKLQFDVLSTSLTLTPSWAYLGNLSPWTTPTVTAIGTTMFKGITYNRFHLTWSTGQAWANGPPGNVPGGAQFHVGVAFSEADFTVPDSVIVTKVALLDGGGNPLSLQPRMAGYDTGALDAADGTFTLNFFNIDNPSRPLLLGDVVVSELPRVASIDSMVRGAKLQDRHGRPVAPWKAERKLCDRKDLAATEGCYVHLQDVQTVTVTRLMQGRHVVAKHDGKCTEGSPRGAGDSSRPPDVNNCPTAGINTDLFPSTMVYVTATVIDPAVKHWDPTTKTFVVGPVESRLFYQIAGRHPDLNRNGIDDFIDIATGTSKDANGDGVPDEVQQCLPELRALEAAELKERNLRFLLADLERREQRLACEKSCKLSRDDEKCERECESRRAKLEKEERESREALKSQARKQRHEKREFKRCLRAHARGR